MKDKELQFEKNVPYIVDFEYLDEKIDFLLTLPNEEPRKERFCDIIHFFKDKKIIQPVNTSFSSSFSINCEDIEYIIKSENLVARRVLCILLNLQNENKSIDSFWYLYDHDSCMEMPQFIHSFFLADYYKIISENVKISTSWMHYCDPNILIRSPLATCFNSPTPLWSNDEKNQNATTLWYYQKFYQETKIGQILAIREGNKLTNFSTSLTVCPQFNQLKLLSSIDKSLKWLIVCVGIILLKMFW